MLRPKMILVCVAGFLLMFGLTAATRTSGEAWLGVMLQSLTDDLREAMELDGDVEGILITEVVDHSPADEAGLEEGDIIVSLEGETATSAKDLVSAIRGHSPGDKVDISVLRDGRQRRFSVELGERKYEKKKVIRIGDAGGLKGLSKMGHEWHEQLFGEQGYLGVHIQDLNDDLGDYFKVKEGEGVLILSVEEDSPAERAGLKAGDVMLEFGGKVVGDADKLRKYVAGTDPGEEVDVLVKRKGRNKTLTVEVGEADSPLKYFAEAYGVPREGPRGRIMVRDEDGEIEVYDFSEDYEMLEPEDFEGHGGKGFIVDLDDLEGLELRDLEDLEDLQDELDKLREEMKELRRELEKLKQ